MKKLVQSFVLLLAAVCVAPYARAQAPNISYGSNIQTYTAGTAIAALKPTNTGGAVPATVYGQVTTIAGSGAYGGADGLGTAASFGQATGIAIDGNGNIYVSDPAFNNIRKITPAGQVSIFAGSTTGESGSANATGTSARFNAPAGIAIDKNGMLYVADAGNNRIRRITAAGVVSNYSGTGVAGAANTSSGMAATFNNPTGIAIDASGTLYVADRGNNLIRKITYLGDVSTVAGSGAAGKVNATGTAASFSGLSGLAIDAAGNLYVTDTNNGLIRKVSTTGEVTSFAGGGNSFDTVDGIGTNARFYLPRYIAIDSFGDLYVTESNVIRKITPAAVVTTLAGNNGRLNSIDGIGVAAGFGSPWGLAMDSQRNLFIADNQTIRKITATGYYINPALPSGLTINPATGEISGTPVAVSPAINYTVTGANVAGLGSVTLSISTQLPAPSAAPAFSPAIATTGSSISIKAAHLTGTSAVSFGGVPASSFIVRSDTLLQAVVAAGNSGNVVVTTPSGTVTIPGFTYTTVPNVSYTTPQTYTVGTAINTLAPTNSGGAVPPLQTWPGVSLYATIRPPVSGSSAYLGGITADLSGNIYVVDVSYNQIKRISPNGTIITFAGSGAAGSANGMGTAASFNRITGITSDVFGNLYVAEAVNRLIRKITPSGLVSTLAGNGSSAIVNGSGTAASFNNPGGITVDGSGNIYVVDGGSGYTGAVGNMVRKITPDGMVSTLAGGSTAGAVNGQGAAARFNGIAAITTDNSGNVYVAEGGNHLIRKITPAGLVTTFAGSGALGREDGVGTAASFRYPDGLTSDGFGNIYVTDDITNGVRRITPSAEVTTLPASLFFADFANGSYNSDPNGITADANGNLYTTGQNQVIKVSLGGYVLRLGVGTGAGLIAPGLTFDEKTGIITGTPSAEFATTTYTVTAYNVAGSSTTNLTLKVKAAPVIVQAPNISYTTPQTLTTGAFITPLTPVNTGGAVPDGYYGQPVTYAADIIATTNDDGTENRFSLRNPMGIAINADGVMFVANYDNSVISKVTPDGVISTFAGSGTIGTTNGMGTAARFRAPAGVAVDAAGNVFVADANNNLIRKITPAGLVSTFAGSGAQGKANGTGTAASFYAPYAMAFDAAGNMYVADNNNLIRKITPAGVVTTFAGSGVAGNANGTGTAASFNSPAGIAVDASGNIYVTDMGNNLIRKITPAGVVTTFAGSNTAGKADGTGTTASFDHPFGIAIGPDGNLYVADGWNKRVRKITPAGVVSTLAASGFYDNLSGIAVDAAGNVYVAELKGLSSPIRKIAATGYAVSPALPAGLDIDETGRIFGSPTTISPATDYTVRAYNAAGSSAATIRIAVTAPVLQAPNISYDGPKTYTVGTAITDLSVSNSGGVVPETLYGMVSTLAGSGAKGNANGTGTAASFYNPGGVAADAAGNVYVADEYNRVIRKISPLGEVTTFAGSGTYGDDDGTGTAASFTQPRNLTLGPDGNIYVSDANSSTIRKITPAGVVTTLAGGGSGSSGIEVYKDGIGRAARFNGPNGVTVDADGNVYVADNGNRVIRKITPAGAVTTLAGSTNSGSTNGAGATATFFTLSGIAVDALGNVYVADVGNNLIRKITPDGMVSTYAGKTGVWGPIDGSITTATFSYPRGVALDATGNLYVSDTDHLIRKISPGGEVSTVAGSGAPGYADGLGAAASFYQPGGIAVGADGNIYVADTPNQRIRKVMATGYSIKPALPAGLTLDGQGRITGTPTAASPATTYTITAYNAAGSSTTTISLTVNAPTPPPFPPPVISYTGPQTYGVAAAITPLAPANTGGAVPPNLYKQVSTLAGSGTGGTTDGTGTAAKFYYPSATARDAAGNIYVADTENQVIRKITPSGQTTTVAGKNGDFNRPTGIAVGADGYLYVADMGRHLILKVSPAGVVSNFAGNGVAGYEDGPAVTTTSFNEPRGIAIDAAGNLYVADAGNCRIRKITPAGQVSTLAGSGEYSYQDGNGTAASFFYPTALTVGAGGNIYVADTYNYRIRKITPTGTVTTLAGSGVEGKADGTGAAASFKLPGGIAADTAGNLYVADTENNLIRMVTLAGKVTTLAGSGAVGKVNGTGTAASFNQPAGLVAGADGNLYIADAPNNLIRKVAYTGYTISPALPAGLALGANGNITGTPTTLSPAATYTITAYNAGGSGTATVSIAVANTLAFAAIPATTYGTADFSPGATAGSNAITYTSSNTAVATIVSGKIHLVGAGTSTITATSNGTSLSQTLTVTPAALTINAGNASKTYGSANPSLTVSYSGFKNGETSTVLTTQPAIATTATAASPVGTYPITASGAAAANYTITYTAGTLTVGTASLKVTAVNNSKTYGSANPVLTATYSGFVNGETAASLTTQPTLATTATTASPAGTYPITASGAAAANYTITYTAGTLQVTPAALTIAASNKSKNYGSANPELTPAYLGFVNGETAASLTTQPTITTTATTTSPVGTYPLIASGAVSANYTITYVTKTLTIKPAALTITVSNKSKTYGSANPGLTVKYSGFKNSETEAVLTTQPTVATTATSTSGVGTYPITASDGAAANYTISYVAGILTVTPATLTITATNKSKAYGTANPALTVSYSGFKNSETNAALTTQPTIATTATTTSPAGTYPITASGAASPNYTINYVAGTLTVTASSITFSPIASQAYGTADFAPGATGGTITYSSSNTAVATIVGGKVHIVGAGTTSITASNGSSTAVQTLTVNKATLSIVADSKTKNYGSANPVLTATYSGFANGETAASLTTQPTLATTASAASPAGTYPVTASGAAAANYNITYTAGSLTVGQVSLVITADNKAKEYGAANPVLTATYSGFVNGETATSLTTQPTLATTATATSPVGTYPITASGATSPNYTISYVAGTLTVTAVAINFSPIASQNYGAADFAPGATGGTITYTSSNTAVATIVAGKVHIVGAGTTSITAGNGASTATQTLTVNKAALVIKADNKLKEYGSVNPVLTATYTGFVNGETAASLTTQPTLTTTATATSTVGTYPVTVSGAAAANYNITYTAGTLTVNPAVLTIAATNKSKTYGTANPALAVTYSGFKNGEGSTVVTTKPVISTTATTASGVGNYAITASGAVAPNYTIAYTAGSLTITPAELFAEANDASRVYGSANPAFTLAYTGFVNGDAAATSFTDLPKANTTATATSPAGGYAITVSGGVAPNYNISYGDGLLTVDKAPLKITAESKTKAYGSANPALTVTYSGFKNGESATALSTTPSISTTATATSGVGTYPITVKAASANNYDITYTAGTLTVTPATLTITAANKSKTYGAANPALTLTYSGFKNSETVAVLTTKPAVATTATTTSAVGNYVITASGAAAPNYTIAYIAGTLTVSPAELLAVANDASRSYGSANPAFAFTYTGFVNGESAATAFTTLPKATTTATATSPAGSSYPITLSGGVAPNYNIIYDDGLLTIARASLKITAANQTKAYGSANPELTFTYSGFKNGESATALIARPTISTTATVASPIGTYPVTIKGASSANYSISYVAGTLTVNKAALIITAEGKSKTYGSENPVLTATYSGFVNGEDENALTAQPTLTTTASTASVAGSYPIAISGATAANYSISYTQGSLVVNPAELLVEAGDAGRTYGAANPVFTLTYTGFVNGENAATAFTTLPNASTSATATSPVGGYAIVAGGGVASNYNISYSDGLLTVAKASLKITADSKSKVYGAANPALTLTYSGFKNGEGATVLSTKPSVSTTATASSPAGVYPITAKGASAGNYTISYTAGTLTVTPAEPLPVLDPAISYASQVFTKGVAITPLKPANAGGAVPATAYAQVSTFAGSSSSGSADGAPTVAKFKSPSGAAFDRAGNLFIVDIGGHVIRKIAPDGTVLTFAGNGAAGAVNATGTAARFSYPSGVAIDANDNLYITDRNNQLIRKITPAGAVTTYAGTGASGSANGNRTSATFGSPTGITIDAAGNLYIADSATGLIRKITPAGIVSTLAGGGVAGSVDGVGSAASFTDPRGIAVDSTGVVYVAEYGSNKIRKISPAGVVTTYAGTGAGGSANGDTTSATFLNPTGLAVDRLNNLYVADYGNSLIRKITPGGVVSTMAGKANASVNTTDAVGTAATFYQPYALTIDAVGSLFVADYGSHRIRKVLTKGYMLNAPPALPAGLIFDATTGTFSGTPTTVTAATAYTVTAYNNYGSSSATFTLAVSNPATFAAAPIKTADKITVVNPENMIDAEGDMPAPKLNPALSPNHDGLNDVLRIDNIERYPDNRVTLMDKSGKSVYEVAGYDNTNKAFDGHAGGSGAMLAPGTYFYMIEYRVKGELKRKTGYFVMKY